MERSKGMGNLAPAAAYQLTGRWHPLGLIPEGRAHLQLIFGEFKCGRADKLKLLAQRSRFTPKSNGPGIGAASLHDG
jgi:hypothetical protein